jgi:hemerythrin superfamily protein
VRRVVCNPGARATCALRGFRRADGTAQRTLTELRPAGRASFAVAENLHDPGSATQRTTETRTMASNTASSTRASTSTRRSTGRKTASSQDALALLRADHDAVLELFDRYESARRQEQKQKLADQICMELKIHTMIEEEIFYPEVREAQGEEAGDALDEATVEHDGAKKLIAEIEASEAGAEMFDAQIKVLGEYVRHHVKEEYRSIFPEAKKSGIDLDEMGARLRARKKELKAEQTRH